MEPAKLNEVEQGELVDTETVQDILDNSSELGSGSMVLEGSLLDYQIDEYPQILNFDLTTSGIEYRFNMDWPGTFPGEKKAEARTRLRDAFLRAGAASHPNIDEVMTEVRSQDDVVLGIDENILRDCTVTSSLLDEIYAETYPNWILISIPRLVMSKIERAAKDNFTDGEHPRVGWPTYEGRVGKRALQEVMDLREKDPARPGLAIMTIGELQEESEKVTRNDWKVDALVRDQFKSFLDEIGFHKGTYFLSQNRVNVMMSGTEGGNALFLQKPDFADINEGNLSEHDFANVLYEVCIQFGTVRLRDQETDKVVLELSSYWPGKNVSEWEERTMNVVTI
jgi:hypothetical protein